MNICVFGDSITKGVVFDDVKNKYTFLKDSFVNLVQAETSVEIKNFAKFGSTTVKGSEIMKKHEDSIGDYDYTFLEFGGNDCDFLWSEIAEDPGLNHQSLVPIDQFRQIYISMIAKVRACGSHPVMLTLPPLVSERFFSWVSRGLDQNNIMKFLGGDAEYIYRWHEQYDLMVREIAAEQNVPLLDIRSAVLSQPDYQSLVCIDGMHPNCRGHRVIADFLAKAVKELADADSAIAKTA